jgi:hypothetical protein
MKTSLVGVLLIALMTLTSCGKKDNKDKSEINTLTPHVELLQVENTEDQLQDLGYIFICEETQNHCSNCNYKFYRCGIDKEFYKSSVMEWANENDLNDKLALNKYYKERKDSLSKWIEEIKSYTEWKMGILGYEAYFITDEYQLLETKKDKADEFIEQLESYISL